MARAHQNVEQVRAWIKDCQTHAPVAVEHNLDQQIQQQREMIADIEQRQQVLHDVTAQQERHKFAVATDDVSDMLESLEQFRSEAGARLEEMLQVERIQRSYKKEVDELTEKIDSAQAQLKTTPSSGSPEQLKRLWAHHNVSSVFFSV